MRVFVLVAASLLALCGCHADEARREEARASGCPEVSLEVRAACEPGYLVVENGCDRAVRHYRCEAELPLGLSRCTRSIPSCALPNPSAPLHR
jgi:hypothetical protein